MDYTPEQAALIADIAEMVSGEGFLTVMAGLDALAESDLPNCPTKQFLQNSMTCLKYLVARAPQEDALFNPPVVEPVDPPELPEE